MLPSLYRRQPSSTDRLPRSGSQALRFGQHFGIDHLAMVRAIWIHLLYLDQVIRLARSSTKSE